MSLLNDLYGLTETKKEDLSKLPQEVMTGIKQNIRKGAEDLQQKWANALELVHKAYEVEGVQRPTPNMDSAWKQYEENLQYAVQQLAKARGMEDDWRMSSSIFHEACKPKTTFRVSIQDRHLNESYQIEASEMGDIIKMFEDTPFDVHLRPNDESMLLNFSRWGIMRSLHVVIEPLI